VGKRFDLLTSVTVTGRGDDSRIARVSGRRRHGWALAGTIVVVLMAAVAAVSTVFAIESFGRYGAPELDGGPALHLLFGFFFCFIALLALIGAALVVLGMRRRRW